MIGMGIQKQRLNLLKNGRAKQEKTLGVGMRYREFKIYTRGEKHGYLDFFSIDAFV